MQLFSVASPLIRELLMSLSTSVAGVPPKLREQRLDSSGVDGESVWLAESSQPQDDAMGFVQPSTEQIAQIEAASNNAGERPILLCNPQWKERDDPLDALSRKEGLLGSLGNFLGGKHSYYSLRATHYPLRTTSYELLTTNYSLRTTSYELLTTSYELRTTH